MNIYGIETLLIGMSATLLIAALFIYLKKRARGRHKVSHVPTFRQSTPTFLAKKSKSAGLDKKIELKPIIIGYLPIYPIARPEAPVL